MKHLCLALLSAALLCLTTSVVSAQSFIYDDTIATCTGLNCSSLRIPGSVIAFGTSTSGGSAGYFEIGLFAPSGRCLRAELISEGADLEMVVRAPNGSIFRNDDKAGASCPLCPRVVINSTPNNGWYSTTLYKYDGASVETNFVLLFGVYPIGNPNCGPATGPQGDVEMENVRKAQKSLSDKVLLPRPGQPGGIEPDQK